MLQRYIVTLVLQAAVNIHYSQTLVQTVFRVPSLDMRLPEYNLGINVSLVEELHWPVHALVFPTQRYVPNRKSSRLNFV